MRSGLAIFAGMVVYYVTQTVLFIVFPYSALFVAPVMGSIVAALVEQQRSKIVMGIVAVTSAYIIITVWTILSEGGEDSYTIVQRIMGIIIGLIVSAAFAALGAFIIKILTRKKKQDVNN